jgi:hypothetical protein
VKLPAHRTVLPGKVILLYIVPLDPAYPALAGRGTSRSTPLWILSFDIHLTFACLREAATAKAGILTFGL